MIAAAARGVLGVVCLAVPGPVLARAGAPDAGDRVVLAAARVLGTRYLLHGLLDVLTGPHPRADASVELAHALSLVPVVAGSARHRRTALLSATGALTVAALDLAGRSS